MDSGSGWWWWRGGQVVMLDADIGAVGTHILGSTAGSGECHRPKINVGEASSMINEMKIDCNEKVGCIQHSATYSR